jgi:hypothetical protein
MVVLDLQNSTSHDDKLFLAQLLTGFRQLLRLGELTFPDSKKLQDWRKVSLRSSVVSSPSSFCYILQTHKADRFFEGNKLICDKQDKLHDPVEPFNRYLSSRDALHPYHAPLWLRSDGSVPTRSWFIKRMRHYFPPEIAGQSMRAGGATALAEEGALPHIIQAAGRWASEAFQLYIRKNPLLLHAMIHSFGPSV